MKLLNFRVDGRDSCGALGPQGIVDLGERMPGEANDVISLLRAGQIEAAKATVSSVAQGDYAPDEVRFLALPDGACAISASE